MNKTEFLVIKTDLFNENSEIQQCRACLEFGVSFSSAPKQEIISFFKEYVKIDVETDNLPKTVCLNCLKIIETTQEFITKCRNSNEYLIEQKTKPEEIIIKQEDSGLKCTNCEQSVVDLMEHYSRQRNCCPKTPKCTICDMTFTRMSSLKRHLFVKHTEEKGGNQCCLCGKQVMTEEGLKRHLRITHKTAKNEAPEKSEEAVKCPHCPKEFAAKYLKRHLLRHRPERPFLCPVCGATFLHKYVLRQHLQSHQGMSFECSECSQTFSREVYLKRHYRKHLGLKPYQCGVCGRSFAFKQSLTGHERSHTGEKPFLCNKCGLRFVTANAFNRHRRTHANDALLLTPGQLECHLCPRKFAYTNSLKKHISTCHLRAEKSGKAKRIRDKFLCPYCGKEFIKDFFQTHVNTHLGIKPYKCHLCDKAFAYKSYMRLHLFTHTGQRPFKCELCEKSFLTKASLTGHVNQIHLKQMPFSCGICEKKYPYRQTLLLHMKTVHWNITVKKKRSVNK